MDDNCNGVIDDAGRILDADVEMNNFNFAFTVDGTAPATAAGRPVADVQNTLTHELGHLLGLDHTCYDGWNPCENGTCRVNHLTCQSELDCHPVDETGAPIPEELVRIEVAAAEEGSAARGARSTP